VAAVGDGEAVQVAAGAEGLALGVGERPAALGFELPDLLVGLAVPLVRASENNLTVSAYNSLALVFTCGGEFYGRAKQSGRKKGSGVVIIALRYSLISGAPAVAALPPDPSAAPSAPARTPLRMGCRTSPTAAAPPVPSPPR